MIIINIIVTTATLRSIFSTNQTSEMELLTTIVHIFQQLIIFEKKLHRRFLTGFWIRIRKNKKVKKKIEENEQDQKLLTQASVLLVANQTYTKTL